MGSYGVTDQGFKAKPLATTQSEVDTDLQKILGASAGTEPDGTIPLNSFAGQLKALVVDGVAACWDLMQAVYSANDPNAATGASQDVVCSLTGTLRNALAYSTVTVTCTGVPLTLLLAGRVVGVETTGALFGSTTDATLAAVAAWASGTAYALGARVTNNGNVYQCTTAGTSAGSGGPTSTGSAIADNTCVWKFLGVGTAAADVPFQAQQAGPVGATAGTLAAIQTPVDGWVTAVNQLDAVVGALQEIDVALRARREAELAAPGNTTVEAIRANILRVNEGSTDPNHQPPTACHVFYNATDFVNSDGMPAHSIEVMVDGGTDADIALAVWRSVGGGSATYGNTTSTVTDSEGNAQTVRWSRPTPVPIYVTASGKYDATAWPSSSDALVAQYILSAILTYGSKYLIGTDVRTSPLIGAAMRGPASVDATGAAVIPAPASASPIPGLLELDSIYIGTTPGPVTSTPIAITTRQRAVFDTSRTIITATTEAP